MLSKDSVVHRKSATAWSVKGVDLESGKYNREGQSGVEKGCKLLD